MERFYYHDTIAGFLEADERVVFGVLSDRESFDTARDQKNAWNERKAFQVNAYRVLLTRARQGMVICVPEGNPEDPTRLPEFYNGTYEYLKAIGIEELDER